MAEKQDNSCRLNAVIFTASILLFIMITGAAIALVPIRVSELVASSTSIWAVSIGGIVVGVGLAVFVAHIAVSFLELAMKTAASGSSPSDSVPPRPRKRVLRLVA